MITCISIGAVPRLFNFLFCVICIWSVPHDRHSSQMEPVYVTIGRWWWCFQHRFPHEHLSSSPPFSVSLSHVLTLLHTATLWSFYSVSPNYTVPHCTHIENYPHIHACIIYADGVSYIDRERDMFHVSSVEHKYTVIVLGRNFSFSFPNSENYNSCYDLLLYNFTQFL